MHTCQGASLGKAAETFCSSVCYGCLALTYLWDFMWVWPLGWSLAALCL